MQGTQDSGLIRQLNTLEVFCIATGAMISSGLFVLPGLIYAKIGPAVIIAYIIAGIFVLPALFAKIELITAMPKAGGSYFFSGYYGRICQLVVIESEKRILISGYRCICIINLSGCYRMAH